MAKVAVTSIIMVVIIASGPKLSRCERVFTVINGCKETVWPGISSKNASNALNRNGFELEPGQSVVQTAPPGWSGRIWGRTGCRFNKSGTGPCQTNNCGHSLNCTGPVDPPFSIAEFTLGNPDHYVVNLAQGFNVPILVTPVNGTGNCSEVGCHLDLRHMCLPRLAVRINGSTVACRSPCSAFNTNESCCSGIHRSPATCRPTIYSKILKVMCPATYSYKFDDRMSIRSCSRSDYVVRFCKTSDGFKAVGAVSQRWWVLVLSWLLIMNFYAMLYY